MTRKELPFSPPANLPSSSTGRGLTVLYLSYDGLSDPLGGSQVLPYVQGLAARGHRMTLVSFEKPSSQEAVAAMAAQCRAAGIAWRPLAYHRRPSVLSTLYDLAALRRLTERLHSSQSFDVIHCRSYLTALEGLRLKRRYGIRLLFDMRGFWPEERVEGGLWSLNNPLFRAIFRYFKRRESELLSASDAVVCLTERAKKILLDRADRTEDAAPITVIPCCVDFDTFPLCNDDHRVAARALLGIAPGARVAAYLGSIGTWYMLDEMLDCFAVQLERDPKALMLFVSRDDPVGIRTAACARGIAPASLIVRAASRNEVPGLVAVADYGLFFIRPTYSKLASCPTKLGEFLAMGLPVLTNTGVGDVDEFLQQSGAGVLVNQFDCTAYLAALDEIETLPRRGAVWRENARQWFDLNSAIDRYDSLYRA
jgi:glycosyltransferase involved in cell wall biosynthesis